MGECCKCKVAMCVYGRDIRDDEMCYLCIPKTSIELSIEEELILLKRIREEVIKRFGI
jgi:hypothetical protein